MIGFDLEGIGQGLKVPVQAPICHTIIEGGSGSGKSTLLLYLIYNARKENCDFTICDFKKSGELTQISDFYAEFEDCFELIQDFYYGFLNTPEGGSGVDKVLVIDEIAGMLTYYGMSKTNKQKADQIRFIMANILMLGRSRRCYLWLSMQRYSAGIFPAASGAGDNFNLCIGLGRLTPDSKRALFSGLELEYSFQPGQGRGIAYIDGQPLKAICVPQIEKKKLLSLLRKRQNERDEQGGYCPVEISAP